MEKNPCKKLLLLLTILSLNLLSAKCFAETIEDTFSLSLEELMKIEVVSASKKTQSLSEIPAAIYVISSQDIKRSGATNIPEILRMAPGVQVLNISASKWSVSIRGGARDYPNKLLVLVDGRSVYSPSFSGVHWDSFNIPVELIEQIEVIRGPNASVWGANAVNGVINIITRNSENSIGAKHNVVLGDQIKISSLLSYGWQPYKDTFVRAHISGLNQNESNQRSPVKGTDSLKSFNAGFRMDKKRENYKFMLSGNFFKSAVEDFSRLFSGPPPKTENRVIEQQHSGLNVNANWQLTHNPNRIKTYQISLENSFLNHIFIKEKRTTLDFDLNQRTKPHKNHDLIWGFAGRLSLDDIQGTAYMKLKEKSRLTSQFRLYFNDEIQVREKLSLHLSAMLEHNQYTGFEFQPGFKLLYKPDKVTKTWMSLSKAVRTPSRIERGAEYYPAIENSLPLPALITTQLKDLDSEEVQSLEIGWAKEFTSKFSLELNSFYSKYKKLAGSNPTNFTLYPLNGYAIIDVALNNHVAAESRGVEASFEWKADKQLNLYGHYAYINVDPRAPQGTVLSDMNRNVPEHMASLRIQYDINDHLKWDNWIRYQSDIKQGTIEGYTTLDTRLSLNLTNDLNLSLVCQNLFDHDYQEYRPDVLYSENGTIGRKSYMKLEWNY